MSVTGPIPPAPLDDGGTGSSDQPTTATYSASSDLDDQLNWMKAHTDDLGKVTGAVIDASQIHEKWIALLGRVLGYIVPIVAGVEAQLIEQWVTVEAQAYASSQAPLEQAAATEAGVAVDILLKAMGGSLTGNLEFGDNSMSALSSQLFNELVMPFTLVEAGLDPSVHGAGLQAQQYLLGKALNMALQEWIVEQLGNHLGMGFFKTLAPFLGILDRSVNPSNIVRQAMESSYALLLKAPLTRDLNRAYPIKDLGVTSLAKLLARGTITGADYYDRCLDSGLNTQQAEELYLESVAQMTRGDITTLLKLGYLTTADATKFYGQLGYDSGMITALLYIDTHERYFTIAERVGGEAVAAWKKGYITQTRLEQILQQTGYTTDEIQLLEIEGEFTKNSTDQKSLDYSQVKALFTINILGIDDVITFLENEGYSATDTIRLVLLDFTKAEERALVNDQLQARLRVLSETERISAIEESKKNETALAAAKNALATELDREAAAYGQLAAEPGIIGLLGGLP